MRAFFIVCFIIAYISSLMLNFKQTRTSPHGDLKIPCSKCHSPEGWKKLKERMEFDHSETGFPLYGKHAAAKCIECHKYNRNGELLFSDIGARCSSCHNDVHTGSLGGKCERCHSFETWKISDILKMHQASRFPLLGVHSSVRCEKCHLKDGEIRFIGISSECSWCHIERYFQVKEPNHVLLNFEMQCENCHSVRAVSWVGERGFHDRTGFPLRGAHARIRCGDCHINGQYFNISPDCYSCHQKDYERASNPNHVVSGFPINCSECHNADAWKPAPGFRHDDRYFRIYSGEHRGRWSSCTDCHIDVNNYRNFSCINCHEHRKSKMDDEHRNVGGYRYESSACYSCHSRV